MKFIEIEFNESEETAKKIKDLYECGYKYAILTNAHNSGISSVWRSKKAALNYIKNSYGDIPHNIEVINLIDYT